MEPGYFLEATSSWACHEMTADVVSPSGSLPQSLNASTVLCNVSWSHNETHVDDEIPRFNELSLVKTVVLLVMFVVAVGGNVATLMRMYRMRRRHSTINTLITHLAIADLVVSCFCNVTHAPCHRRPGRQLLL